jgi:SAM-dependent methyltransferase
MRESVGFSGSQLSRLYSNRFSRQELAVKEAVWRILCDEFFQRYVETTDAVVDLGAGTCEFINAIHCADKIAVDLNPDVERHVRGGKAIVAASTSMPAIPTGSVDVVFTSNFFEHLPSKPELLGTLGECHRILRDDGRLMVLMPNIRYLPGRYWDYFDHHLALTHFSLVEALALSGFRPEVVLPRFLPYTTKHSRAPRLLPLLRLYLRMPFVWRFVGKQMFVVGRRVELTDEVDALD